MYQAYVETPRHPTESAAKVKQAVLNVFPEARLEEGVGMGGEAGSLDRFAELLRNQRIRDSAHEVLTRAIQRNRMVFYLNKQAALAGRVSFSAHAPLGDICVTVVSDGLRDLVEKLAPATVRSGGRQPRPAP